jgi:hypothetical protein
MMRKPRSLCRSQVVERGHKPEYQASSSAASSTGDDGRLRVGVSDEKPNPPRPPEDPGCDPIDPVAELHAGVPHGSSSEGRVDSSTAVRPFGRIARAFLAHPVWGGIGGIVGIAALILTLLALVGVFSGGGSKGAGGAAVTSAVDEIAKRPLWSSPPITYSEANKAVESHEPLPRGQEVEGGAEEPRGYVGEGGALTVPPNAILATQLAKEPEKYVRTGLC